jgi:hypothetical protein
MKSIGIFLLTSNNTAAISDLEKFLGSEAETLCHFTFLFSPMALPPHSGPRPLIQFRNYFLQIVRLLG